MNIMNFIVRPSNFLLLKMFQKFAIEGQRYFLQPFSYLVLSPLQKEKNKQERIPVGCVPPAYVVSGGGIRGGGIYPTSQIPHPLERTWDK